MSRVCWSCALPPFYASRAASLSLAVLPWSSFMFSNGDHRFGNTHGGGTEIRNSVIGDFLCQRLEVASHFGDSINLNFDRSFFCLVVSSRFILSHYCTTALTKHPNKLLFFFFSFSVLYLLESGDRKKGIRGIKWVAMVVRKVKIEMWIEDWSQCCGGGVPKNMGKLKFWVWLYNSWRDQFHEPRQPLMPRNN